MKVLVCGGRNFGAVPTDTPNYAMVEAIRKARMEAEVLYANLDRIHKERPITMIIHGAARGADTVAGEWARSRRVACKPYPADWKRHARAAGPLRNALMLTEKPELVVAARGNAGTQDMINKSREAGIDVVIIQ